MAARKIVALGSSILDVATLRGCSLGYAKIQVTDEAMERVAIGRDVVSVHAYVPVVMSVRACCVCV